MDAGLPLTYTEILIGIGAIVMLIVINYRSLMRE